MRYACTSPPIRTTYSFVPRLVLVDKIRGRFATQIND